MTKEIKLKRILMKYLLFFLAGSLVACSKLAILTTPKKQPVASQSETAEIAQQHFWNTLHQGRYIDIPQTEKLLTAAYLENPNDPAIAAHLGFLHIWQIAERQRLPADPRIVNHIILSTRYFFDAVELDPSDARYLGFLGDSKLIQGQIFKDKRQQVKGYFILKTAVAKWPEFNYFTAGYAMSSLPSDSKFFKQGLEWQWRTLDLCAAEKVDRQNPDFSRYMQRETQQGQQRACWNSWIAPYNFEGFFLNMGDMLVKSGDWQTAQKIYANAKLANNYNSWPYQHVLQNRINNAQKNIAAFNQPIDPQTLQALKEKVIMFNSEFACMACHQQAKAK